MMSTHKKAYKLDVTGWQNNGSSCCALSPFEPTFEAIRTSANEVYVHGGGSTGSMVRSRRLASGSKRAERKRQQADDLKSSGRCADSNIQNLKILNISDGYTRFRRIVEEENLSFRRVPAVPRRSRRLARPRTVRHQSINVMRSH